MAKFDIEKLKKEVRQELNKMQTRADDPSYQKGIELSKVKEQAKKLLENEKLKSIICSGTFRSVYELGDLIAEILANDEIVDFIITGDLTIDFLVLLIAHAAKRFTDKIDIEEYCKDN